MDKPTNREVSRLIRRAIDAASSGKDMRAQIGSDGGIAVLITKGVVMLIDPERFEG